MKTFLEIAPSLSKLSCLEVLRYFIQVFIYQSNWKRGNGNGNRKECLKWKSTFLIGLLAHNVTVLLSSQTPLESGHARLSPSNL